jgi:hypothetical protein
MAVAAVKELEAGDVVAEEVSQETVPTTDDATADRQPETKNGKPNLDNLPEFRQYKSEEQKRFAAQERRLAALEARHQQELAQARQEIENRKLAEMDDYQRLEYTGMQTARERDEALRRLQEYEIKNQRQQALLAIAEEASEELEFSIPVSALVDAESPDQAWRLAARYKRTKQQEAAKNSEAALLARQQKRENNRVEVGSGNPPPSSTGWEARYKKALESGSAVELAKLTTRPKED